MEQFINVYIAEILTGRAVEKPHFFWHGTSDASVKTAKEYLETWELINHWKSTPQAIDFVDWLYNSAVVMQDRFSLAAINEALTYEHDPVKRALFCNKSAQLIEKIMKVPILVKKVVGRRGEQHWPWEHSRADLLLEE